MKDAWQLYDYDDDWLGKAIRPRASMRLAPFFENIVLVQTHGMWHSLLRYSFEVVLFADRGAALSWSDIGGNGKVTI